MTLPSRKDPRWPIGFLTLRQATRIGTWNVRSMYQTGKTSIIASEMRKYKLKVLGLSEVRWTQSGKVRVATGETLLYSGLADRNAQHTEGVALMISK